MISSSEGHGKQFVFSLWDANDAKTGTSTKSGIGGGSFCTVSSKAVDGQNGVQCRYLYDWQVGHTYRFRVVPDIQLGEGGYKSSVTDVTPGSRGDSFDIGSIQKSTGNRLSIPAGDIIQWVEYIDWNIPATTCLSVAHSDTTFSVHAYDLKKHEITLPVAALSTSDACPSSSTSISQMHSEVRMIGGPNQSAEGFIRDADDCILSALGEPPQMVLHGTCPSENSIKENGGENSSQYLWVLAHDKTIQQKSNMCLTADSGESSSVSVNSCVPGLATQQWEVNPNEPGQIKSVQSGKCFYVKSSGITGLRDCKGDDSKWVVPGKVLNMRNNRSGRSLKSG